jgi:hypothetical protein
LPFFLKTLIFKNKKMSELKTVYNKLFKTELASQKVELASVKELDSILSDGKSQIDAIEKQGAILGKKLGEAIVERRKFEDAVKSLKTLSYLGAKKAVDDFKSKAKDLGVDISNIPQLKDIEKLIASTREYDSFDKNIPKIPEV